jgi:hypothetical protein
VVDHLDDRRHPAALLADQPRPGAAELDLRGGIGAVAQLVLEPLDVDAIALTVGRKARQQEAGETALGLSENEKGVAHRRRHEPLVAGDRVLGAGAAAIGGYRHRAVGAHVRAALLLGHAHSAKRSGLVGRRAQLAVVVK